MGGGGVPFVNVEAVLREAAGQADHVAVAVDLGENGGDLDGSYVFIAVHDREGPADHSLPAQIQAAVQKYARCGQKGILSYQPLKRAQGGQISRVRDVLTVDARG